MGSRSQSEDQSTFDPNYTPPNTVDFTTQEVLATLAAAAEAGDQIASQEAGVTRADGKQQGSRKRLISLVDDTDDSDVEISQPTQKTKPRRQTSFGTATGKSMLQSTIDEQSPPKVTSEANTNQLADITSAQLDLHSVTALTNTETSTETATFSPSGDEKDLNKSPTTPKQGTECSTLIDEDNNMCLVLSSVNTTDPRCDRNKLDATAGLEVSDPTNEIESSKEAAEIAYANDIVYVASSHDVNLPLDKVFASSPPILVTGPGTAGASFTSNDDLIHRTQGGRLIKPSLKGDRANLGSRNQEKVLSEINGTHFSPCLAGILEGPYVLGRPVSQRNTKAVVEDADGDAERVKNMGKGSITDDMKSFGVKIKRQNLGYFTIASILFSLAETTIIIITVKGHEKDMWTASRHLDRLLSFLETSGIDCRFQLLGHGPESQQRFHRKPLEYQLYNIVRKQLQLFAMPFQYQLYIHDI
ncbi:hypothetical protein Bca52824_054709 [Brassica carinata]|uniref:Uncharacterized protein n=1 Tax=Brassica carinata TaxID=52824 RepID=A0A8X7R6M0_BRACI|nr:hypothetical protein Bca52824_054709 [Brassica carinata]